MWLSLISLVLGSVPAVVGEIAKARFEAANAKTEQQRIAADERVKALEAQRDVLVAESKSPWNTLGRLFLMAPFGIYAWKLVIWDKVLNFGTTDDLSLNLWALMFTVFGFYFVTDITRILRR